jgi:adenylate cyclase
MTVAPPSGAWIRPVRLACGLILFAYLFTHFSNHALGLVSLETMEAARLWFLKLWRNPVGETALFGALFIHYLLGLWLIYARKTLRMPAWEATQILLGLVIPPLLAYHAIGTRYTNAVFGTEDLYARIVYNQWVGDPWAGVRQFTFVVLAWTHGCIGLHYWLRIRPWYARRFPVLLSALVLVPVLALLGVTQAGREITALARDPGYIKQLNAKTRAPNAEQRKHVVEVRDAIFNATWVLLGLTLAARLVRAQFLRRRQIVRIRYRDSGEVAVPLGWTVLEASRSAGIPHTSVCGGRARCSTCRVRVAGDHTVHPPPAPLEQRVLERVGAPPNVRLACQLRPTRDIEVTRLIQAAISAGTVRVPPGARDGQEIDIVVLFADLRGFTRMAERKLPYDVVFILNRYFEAVGGAVAQAGGVANQYTGDGVMALFGIETDSASACRQALLAAGAMIARLDELSRSLASELPEPLKLGIGIHVGPAVVGEMGYDETRYLTAVGDTVNAAARLEALTKEYRVELVVSEEVLARAEVPAAEYPRHQLTLRNRESPLEIAVIADARKLAEKVIAAPASHEQTPDAARVPAQSIT